MIEHSIKLELNSTGFDGKDIDELLPVFITERNTNVGLTWFPSAYGPTSFSLIITISVTLIVGEALREFVRNLSKDLYYWGKEKLIVLLNKKEHPNGYVCIQLGDIKLIFNGESLFDDDSGGEVLLDFFNKIPNFLVKIDPSVSSEWEVLFDKQKKEWLVQSVKKL